MKKSMLRFCSCRACRDGMHRGRRGSSIVRRASRKARHTWNALAKEGRDEEILPVGVPFTD